VAGQVRRWLLALVAASLLPASILACGDDADGGPGASPDPTSSGGNGTSGGDLVVYSGRAEALVGPILARFEEATGLGVSVKYGDTAELAALLAEEGDRSPADVYFAQDAGALGAVSDEGLLEALPADLLEKVDVRFRSPGGEWIGISGRARVIAYNPDNVDEADLPGSVLDLTGEEWEGRVGWAPTNGSFQAFVTALRQLEGEDGAREWLEGMLDNGVQEYPNNNSIVAAVAEGEIDIGLVNHYYLYGFIRDQGDGFNARNHFTRNGDAGSLVNVAGVGVLASSDNKDAARALVAFLLEEEAQHYFSEETFEYPLVTGIEPDSRLPSLADLNPPDLDLGDLHDLQGTLALLRDSGVLP
jgi:iron(III) transport system substrate-binding protein